MMDVFNLPQDIFPGKNIEQDEIIIHDYAAHIGTFKGRSILHSNAISLVISGQKTMHFAEKTVYVTDSEIHFLSSGNCLASMDLSRQRVFRSILVFFTDKILTDFYIKYNDLVSRSTLHKQIAKESYVSLKKDGFINNYISSLVQVFDSGNNLSAQMRQLKFEELMLYLLEKYPLTVLSFQKDQKQDFNDLEIRKIIETNITNNLTIEELAFLCNTSLSTFKRRFARIYHTSPNKWFLQRRMDIAAHLLKNHNEKPSEVFHKLGYENHSSFSQSFKQVYGITPKEYQLQY